MGGTACALAFALALGLVGCTTQGRFVIPKGTQLEVYRRPVTPDANGLVVTKPFFWTAAGIPPGGGVEYRLLRDGKVVQEGRLRTKFRVVSIFWPPAAAIYWPMGLNPEITYDLVKGKQE
jgi:hypothetical protein